jgi:hypothetical protein
MYFKNKKQNTLIILILSIFTILLFFPMLVVAEMQVNTYTASKDFNVMSKYDSVEICGCSTKYDSIIVTNTGSWPAIFTIATESQANKITLSENSFELLSGTSKEIFLYITADCGKGSEDVKIVVTSNLGTQKTLTKSIVRTTCQNIETWVANYTANINPCESKKFEINVHNIGPFTESYTIDSEYDQYLTYNTKKFELNSNEYVKISATLKLGCEIYGKKDIIFNVKSVKNKLTAPIIAQINILQNYDYEIKVNNEIENNSYNITNIQVCNRISSKLIPISITNEGSVSNEYAIDISNLPKNAKILGIENNKLIINPSETKTFNIEIDSTNYRSETKDKKVTITIIPKLGNINKKVTINLNFMPCYEHEIIVYDYENSKRNPLRTCEDYDYSYNINLINRGLFKEKYTLTLVNTSSEFKLSEDTVSLSPKDNAIIKLLITGPKDNDYHNIILKITSEEEINEYENIWIKSYDSQSCHNTLIKKTQYNINYDTKYIKIPLVNKGIVENKYLITWNGSKIINSDIILTTINKSKSQNIILKLNSSNKEEGTYDGDIIVQTATGSKYIQEINIKLKDKSIIRKAFEYLAFGNTCKNVSLYSVFVILILIILIIAILIRGPNYPYKFRNRLKSKISVIIFLTALFLIGVILVILIAGLPKNQMQVYNLTTNSSELTYEWLENEKYVLDASNLFYDPENSTLKYNVTGLKNIKAVINAKTITFYPDKGWSGTEYATITAYDNMDGKVSSPKFTLIVKNMPRKSFVELYNIYCWYTNLIIYALILLLIFVAVFVKQKRRGRK